MSDKLEKLQAKWNQKLKDSGFEDIEQKDGNLKSWHSMYFMCRYSAKEFAEKQEYYRLARQYLEYWPFKSERQKRVWDMMEVGRTYKEMAKSLRTSTSTISAEVASLLERRVWAMYVSGATMAQIGKALPISRAKAHQIVQEIREDVKLANID